METIAHSGVGVEGRGENAITRAHHAAVRRQHCANNKAVNAREGVQGARIVGAYSQNGGLAEDPSDTPTWTSNLQQLAGEWENQRSTCRADSVSGVKGVICTRETVISIFDAVFCKA